MSFLDAAQELKYYPVTWKMQFLQQILVISGLIKKDDKMKILELDIEGFRSLKKIHWQPGDLNVIIGLNGSGKSNLLRMLELIAISAQGQLGKYIQNSGGIDPLLWDGATEQINFRVKTSTLEKNTKPGNYLTYNIQMNRLGKTSAYRINKENLVKSSTAQSVKRMELFKYLDRIGPRASVIDENEKNLKIPKNSIPEEETVLSQAALPFYMNRGITDYRNQLASWRIYHDINVDKNSPIRESAVARLDKTVQLNALNLISVFHTLYASDRYFKQDIDLAMRSAFGDDFDELIFPPAADQRIQMRIRWKSLRREQSAADMSDGTLRFLILLAVLASPTPPPLIAYDEPETGLHPSMLPIIAEYSAEASKRTQVIFTTHSPQFLDAFGQIEPTVTVSKWKGGQTELNTLAGDKLKKWLQEYSLGSLYRSGELEDME